MYLYMGSKTAYVALLGRSVAPLEAHVARLGHPELPQRLPGLILDRFSKPRHLQKPAKML